MKNRTQSKILIYILFFLVSFLVGTPALHAKPHYKIGVVHSYEKSYYDAERYRHVLEKELSATGMSFEICELFLNCDELSYYDEIDRASFFVDEFVRLNLDAVAVFNNQAVYSLLKCGNPKLHHIPVVFSGVYYPDEELIRQYPNVTGYVDIPDYPKNVRMIERIMGKSRIVVMSGTGMVDKNLWINLEGQCGEANIKTYDGDVLSHVLAHRVIKNAYEEESRELYNEHIDTTVVMRLMSDSMSLRTIQQTTRGSETYLMLTARTNNTMNAPDLFLNPSFAVINEGFGSNDKMLGGYFATLETQLKDLAEGISLRLQGKMPEQQITQSRKQYVLNWNVLQRYGIDTKDLPEEYKVMYIPFTVRYHSYIISGYILGVVLLLAFITYLLCSLARERKRKRVALHNLMYERETLELAIEGGTTYAWRRENDSIAFDSHFYKLIDYDGRFITKESLLPFINSDDRERFSANFLKLDSHTNYKGQYRCNFSGEYQWWEFRYSFIFNRNSEPMIAGLLQNVQEIKDHESELIQSREIAEKAELKQSFLNNMSHEIRTPLNAIVGFSNLLATDPDLSEKEKQDFINIVKVNNDLLLKLINDILDLSRIDSNQFAFDIKEHDVRTLLDSYYQTCRVQINPDLEFIREYPAENVTIRVDSMSLQQVVSNLVINSNKFTVAGYIKLGYYLPADKNEVHIFVEDSGKGIPKDEQSAIFSRFYKRDKFAQGTGLGLSICQGIIEHMNGHIDVVSELGKGSRFIIVLPLG